MNIDEISISTRTAPFVDQLAKLASICLRDCGKHGRGGSVTMQIKCKLDKEGHNVMALLVLKIKHPTGIHKDETCTTEEEEIGCWRIDEEQGQMKIGEVE